jgi:hypothetical protein
MKEILRRLVPALVAVVIAAGIGVYAEYRVTVPGGDHIAGKYKFTEQQIAMPPGYDNQPMHTVRQVNPAYQHIAAWISSVGAGIAINDLTGHGIADSMCIVDTRTNSVIVTYTPTARPADRFTPFVLNPAPLPVDAAMAPTGCTPGDFTGDGRMDLLVSYWGRTPILFLAKQHTTVLSAAAYQPVELIPTTSSDGKYHGPRWNTDAVAVGDYDGTGHPDIFVGNYFPDSDVLDPHGLDNVVMNTSLSNATNGGGDHVFRWTGVTPGVNPTPLYIEERDALPFNDSTGWTLAVSSADLTGDGLPDLYIANDFGHGHLMYNISTPGHIQFSEAVGQRTPMTPKSFVLGKGSFKGMGVEFGDLRGAGKFDMVVSDITSKWGLQESNLVWINQADNNADMQHKLSDGIAPFKQEASRYGVAWTGWSWDVKMADFLNDGNQSILQADGFVRGSADRWNWLQEMAMTNDDLLVNPAMWPNVKPGADISGHQVMAFYAKTDDGRYANIAKYLGIKSDIPTRAIAVGDTTGTGTMDFAAARQWGPPVFYRNDSPRRGDFLELNLIRPATGGGEHGTPAYGATVTVTTHDGHTQIAQLDGGGGHSGFRSFDVHFGLGSDMGSVTVELRWRDTNGRLHDKTLPMSTGRHTLTLTASAQEAQAR